MDINALADKFGFSCYGFLILNFTWGLYCSILLWRRTSQLRFRSEQLQNAFLEEVQQCLERRDFQAVAEVCQEEERALPRLVLILLRNMNLTYQQLRQLAAELVHREVLADLEPRLSWIATVIKSGPYLGLFGTVLGMMAAFGRMGQGTKVTQSEVAHDISVALICTAGGLLTAIPFSYVLASLNIRVRGLQDSVTGGLSRVLELLRVATGKP